MKYKKFVARNIVYIYDTLNTVIILDGNNKKNKELIKNLIQTCKSNKIKIDKELIPFINLDNISNLNIVENFDDLKNIIIRDKTIKSNISWNMYIFVIIYFFATILLIFVLKIILIIIKL